MNISLFTLGILFSGAGVACLTLGIVATRLWMIGDWIWP
jgi:hypothetical protein